MTSVPTLIFDMDGVLVDSEPVANAVFAAHLGRHGVEMTAAQAMAAFRGRSLLDCVRWIEAEHRVQLPDTFLDTLQEETFVRLRAELQPIPHIAAILEQLRPLQCCVASSSERAKIDLSLELTGLSRFFANDRRFSGWEVERGKPAPDLFLHAARAMGVPPIDCLVIEDSVSGVQAAWRAGMQPIGYAPRGSQMQDPLVGAGAVVFSDMRSLPAMIVGVWQNILIARQAAR